MKVNFAADAQALSSDHHLPDFPSLLPSSGLSLPYLICICSPAEFPACDLANLIQVRVDKVEYRRPDPPKDQTTPIPKPEVPAGW
jgi:hypothetical protein